MILVLCDRCHQRPPGSYDTFRMEGVDRDFHICEPCQGEPFRPPTPASITVVVSKLAPAAAFAVKVVVA